MSPISGLKILIMLNFFLNLRFRIGAELPLRAPIYDTLGHCTTRQPRRIGGTSHQIIEPVTMWRRVLLYCRERGQWVEMNQATASRVLAKSRSLLDRPEPIGQGVTCRVSMNVRMWSSIWYVLRLRVFHVFFQTTGSSPGRSGFGTLLLDPRIQLLDRWSSNLLPPPRGTSSSSPRQRSGAFVPPWCAFGRNCNICSYSWPTKSSSDFNVRLLDQISSITSMLLEFI